MAKVGETFIDIKPEVNKQAVSKVEKRMAVLGKRVGGIAKSVGRAGVVAIGAVAAAALLAAKDLEKPRSALEAIKTEADTVGDALNELKIDPSTFIALREQLQLAGVDDPIGFLRNARKKISEDRDLRTSLERQGATTTEDQILTLLNSISKIDDASERSRQLGVFGLSPSQGEKIVSDFDGFLNGLKERVKDISENIGSEKIIEAVDKGNEFVAQEREGNIQRQREALFSSLNEGISDAQEELNQFLAEEQKQAIISLESFNNQIKIATERQKIGTKTQKIVTDGLIKLGDTVSDVSDIIKESFDQGNITPIIDAAKSFAGSVWDGADVDNPTIGAQIGIKIVEGIKEGFSFLGKKLDRQNSLIDKGQLKNDS